MRETTIDIGRDFSEVPSGRFPEDGDFNGERFRREWLMPSLRDFDQVIVVVDNTEGFGSSFLEEAFGGLIRKEGFSKGDLDKRLYIVATKASKLRYKRKIAGYLDRAKANVED